MKHKTFLLVLLLPLLFITACGGETPPTQKPDTNGGETPPTLIPEPDTIIGKKGMSDITLKVGEEITLEGVGITLRLNAVTEDSRCPTTVRCIHAGWVTVDLSIIKNGEQTGQFFFTLPAEREDQSSEVAIDNFTIRLLEVSAYPNQPGNIEQNMYSVGLEVIE